jgi:tetratricopeptide (TPR) repeat protein
MMMPFRCWPCPRDVRRCLCAVLLGLSVFVQAFAQSKALSEALALQNQGKADEAIALLRHASLDAPTDAAVHNLLGALLNRSGMYPEALVHAQAAVTHAPDNARYRLNRGIVLNEHGRFADAIADFDYALARDTSFVYGYLERGAAMLSLDRDADAREQWALARRNDPKLIWPEWYEAVHDFIDRRYADAAAKFDRVAAAEPGFGPAGVWRTLARARAGLPIPASPAATSEWPAPLYRLQRGQLTLDQVLAIAEQDRATGDRRRVGEALFVAAEMAAVAGRGEDAVSLYRSAAAVPAPRHAWKIAAERQAVSAAVIGQFPAIESQCLRRSHSSIVSASRV